MIWVESQGRPIAAALNFSGADSTYAYQVGIDPEALEENPGWLVNTALLQHAIQTGQRRFDLLRGDEPYTSHLRAQPQAAVEIRIVPHRLRPQLWYTAWRTGTTMKGWLRAGLTRSGIL
jgi:CelD/BcsL family acetyltransferase involved in cellulose biosynthesis